MSSSWLYIQPLTRRVAPRTFPFLVLAVMLPRRKSSNVTSASASPRQTSGTQQVFRAPTTPMVKLESPESEISPRDSPPALPPRPAPPHNEFRSQSSRRAPPPTVPYFESADIFGDIHPKIWPIYNRISMEYDEVSLAKWNKELDTPIIFVSQIIRAGHRFRSD